MPNSSSLVICRTFRSCRSYRSAVAGVRKKDPKTMVAMKGRPKSRNGCFARAARYFAGSEELYEDARNFFDGKTAMVVVY